MTPWELQNLENPFRLVPTWARTDQRLDLGFPRKGRDFGRASFATILDLPLEHIRHTWCSVHVPLTPWWQIDRCDFVPLPTLQWGSPFFPLDLVLFSLLPFKTTFYPAPSQEKAEPLPSVLAFSGSIHTGPQFESWFSRTDPNLCILHGLQDLCHTHAFPWQKPSTFLCISAPFYKKRTLKPSLDLK